MNKKNTILIGILIVIAVVIGGLFYFTNVFNKNSADVAPSLDFVASPDDNSSDINYNNLIMNSGNLASVINSNDLIGNWKEISEEVNGENSSDVNITMGFNSDSSYFISGDLTDNGFYQIVSDNGFSRISFYNTKSDIGKQESSDEAFGNINGNKLTLVYPKYPKVVIYEKQ